MTENPLRRLNALGQSVWLDNLTRAMVTGGALKRLVEEDGLSGITSNPAIFEKAIAKSADYDDQIRELAGKNLDTTSLFEHLAIRDIRGACDVLRPVYDRTGGADGFVSLEVSPHLARDTAGTLAEARRLWKAVERPNVMIKIPGTDEGLPAIRDALAEGININVTLLFGLAAYRKVMEAHQEAMEIRLGRGLPPDGVASVASFFLSRIDVMIDERLDAMAASNRHADEARALRGKAAIASAKLAYRLWKDLYARPAWKQSAAAGAGVQRPLWASTSTKDPVYPDVMYVEPLIGPHTVNTMPDSTLEAFRDHGRAAVTVEDGVELQQDYLDRLRAVGIDIDEVTAKLVDEGIEKFVKPFDSLLASLEEKRSSLAAG